VELGRAFEALTKVLAEIEEAGFVSDGLVHDAAADHRFSPEAFGAILMQHFHWESGSNTGVKSFLVELAAALGPDHIDNLRRSVAFMQKVDSF
jgi:hypothetical protein